MFLANYVWKGKTAVSTPQKALSGRILHVHQELCKATENCNYLMINTFLKRPLQGQIKLKPQLTLETALFSQMFFSKRIKAGSY